MARKPFIAGNWKMFKTVAEAVALVDDLKAGYPDSDDVDVLVCPSFLSFAAVATALEGSAIMLGAQNMHAQPEGAYTGEVSAQMLLSAGAEYVIVGHSERRAHFGECDATVNGKVIAALEAGLKPILCVGETLREREESIGDYSFEYSLGSRGNAKLQLEIEETWGEVLRRQVERGAEGLSEEFASKLTLAYEPVWAIGTGRTATPEIAAEAHSVIRQTLNNMFGADIAKKTRILYGGSVKPGNIKELISERDIDGALVGGAALKAETFLPIMKLGE